MSVSVSTTAGNQVTVVVDGTTQLSFTTEDSSISVVNGETSSISVTNQGPKGDTGATGAKGDTGPQGPAGTSPNAFTTISVAGQNNVIADGVDDTLTIAGGSNVTVTTDSSSDTITIASADTNLGNSDQTLSAERTIEMSTNRLIFDNSSTEVASIFPQGYIQATGRSIVNGNGSIGGLLNLKDADSSNGVTLRCPNTVASDLTLILPDSDGSAGQVLKTDGSGNLSFVDQTSDTNTNIYTTDGALTGDRTIDLGSNDLIFDGAAGGTGVASISSVGDGTFKRSVTVQATTTSPGTLQLKELSGNGTNHVSIAAPDSLASNTSFILPAADGSADHILKTDGSGNLSFRSHRGGTYSYSGYSTSVTKTATFYYQFADATATSSSNTMIGSFVGQGISHSTYGSNGALTVNGTSSTDSVTYSITVKITTNVTVVISTLCPSGGQFVPATQIVTASGSEQTFTLTQSSPTNCLAQGGREWSLGLQVLFAGSGSIDFCVSDLSITVT